MIGAASVCPYPCKSSTSNALKKVPISKLSGAPPETIAFSLPPNRAATFLRTSFVRSGSRMVSPRVVECP